MSKKIHHCALYEYHGVTYIYELPFYRQLMIGEFLDRFVDDLLKEEPSRVLIDNLDIYFDHEQLFHYRHFNVTRPVVRPVKQSTGSACASRR